MTSQPVEPAASGSTWQPRQVYLMATICLLLGVALGYLFRGSETTIAIARAPGAAQPSAQPPSPGAMGQMPTLEQMKHMADKQAEPLLAQLKQEPNNPALFLQIAKVYQSTHQFKEAAGYYGQSLNLNPQDVSARNAMASCLFYTGDTEGALDQLQQSLQQDPKDADALFNLGVIRWKGKNDPQGAVTAWESLLKLNPRLEPDKKSQVEKLIAEVRQTAKSSDRR